MAHEFIIKNGFVSKGNSLVEGNLSGQTFNIINTPVNNNSATEILVRNTTSGNVEYRDSSTLSGASSTDVFVNSGSADVTTQQLTFTNTTGGTFNVTNAAALFTDNDINVTGGTYDVNTGCVTFATNSGSTFDICGFVTGLTNTFVSGGTYDSSTSEITFTNTTGGTFNVDLSSLSGKTSFTVAGDNGTPFTITSGDTLTFEGSTGIDIGVAATDRVLIAVDYSGADSVIMAATNGTGITVDGANDKLLIYDNDTATVKYINANQLPSSGAASTPITGYSYNPASNTFTIGLSGGTSFDSQILEVSGLTVTNDLIVSGSTGIGTDTPTEKLHIKSTTNAKIKIEADINDVDDTDTADILLSQDGGISTSNIGISPDSINDLVIGVNSTTDPSIKFATRNDGTTFSTTADTKVTITNSGSVGIGTIDPTEKLHVMGDFKMEEPGGTFDSDLNSGNALVRLSAGTTNQLARIAVSNPGEGGITFGVRGSTEASFPGYGAQGDGYLYSSIDQNGLNIISAPSSPAGTLPDYIRMYAGQDADGGVPDIHIQGKNTTDSSRGNVGINTDTPTETFHVDGTVRIEDGTEQLGYVLTCDADGVASWQPSSGSTTGGTVYWDIENGGLKSINQNAGTINGTSTGSVLVGGYFNTNDIYDSLTSTIINGNSNTISGGTTSAIISTSNSNIKGTIDYGVIIGGSDNNIEDTVSDSERALIAGGVGNDINNSFNSAMLSTVSSTISGGSSNIILGGNELNIIEESGGSLMYSSIIGGNQNTIQDTTNGGSPQRSTIIGGRFNTLSDSRDSLILSSTGSEITGSCTNSSIYNASNSLISNATASSILGGSVNIISGGTENAIIGGSQHKIINGTQRSVILGGRKISGGTTDTVYVPNLNIGTVGAGTPLINLGLDANGFVVTGTTGSGGGNSGITGYTYDPTENEFAIGISGSTPQTAIIDEMNGLTINGELRVTGNTQLDSDLIVDGNTGMGTDNPLEKLDVRGDVLISNPVDNASLTLSAVSTSNSVIDFDNEGVSTPFARIEGTTFGGGVSGNLQFYTYPTGGPLSEVMVLTNNQRVGIGDITNNDVDKTLHVMGDFKMEETGAIFESDLNLSSGANVKLSAITTDQLARMSVATPGNGGITFGIRGSAEASFPGYGAQGDGYLYSSIDQNGLNIISAPSNPANALPDYIRMYAGQDADGGIPDIHIQGRDTTDSTRGYVGINTDTPTETFHVDGTVRIEDGTEQNGYVLTCDADGVASWQPSSGGTGTGFWAVESGGLKSINQNSGTISGTSTGAILVGGYFTNNDITDGRASTIINGGANIISGASADAIISSTNSSIIANNGSLQYSVIVGGLNNFIQGGSSDTLIGGGINNEIVDGETSSIIGGRNNLIDDSDEAGIYTSEDSTLNKATKSAIIGGNDHFLAAARSVIVGGSDNYMDGASRSVILGGSNITADTSNTVYVPQLNIRDVLDNEPVGTLGYDANGFVVDSNVSDITGGTLNGDVLTLINNNGNNITISGFSSGSTSGFWEEGGEGNSLYDIKGSHILTGSSRYSMIAGGETNRITDHDSSGIFVGKNNVLTGSSVGFSESQNAIIGGEDNIISSNLGYMDNNIVLGGNNNSISDGRIRNSIIIGGKNHSINDTINDSVVIGGNGNKVKSQRSVVLGGAGITGTTDNDTVYVPRLNIRDVSNGTPTMNLGVDANGVVVSAATGSNSGNCISELWVSNIESCSPLNINTYNQGNIYIGTQGGLPLVTIDITTPDEPGILFGEESFIKYNESQKKLKVGADSATGSKLVLETDGREIVEVSTGTTRVIKGDLEAEDGNIIVKSGNSKSLIVEDIPDVSGANLGTDLDGKIIDLPSDSRCKFNILDIPNVVDPILFLDALEGYQFEFHPRTRISSTGKKHYGFKVDDFRDNLFDGNVISAEQRRVNNIAKTFVRTCKTQYDIDGSGNKATVDSMNYVDLIPFMVEGIKQLNTNINNITGGGKKYVETKTLTTGQNTITHSLKDENVIVQVVEISTGQIIIPDHISNYQNNSVDIYVEEGGEYKIIIIG
tara:strand:+ start:6289 stop:12429 length:6141 start_codon:yes stop_codon:yes gene_type:complete